MSGYRPAGESSDEDDYDGFSFGDDFGRSRNRIIQPSVNTAEQDRFQRENNICEILRTGTLADLIDAHRSQHGFQVSEPLCNDWTPLLHAAYAGRVDMTEWLVNNGADVNYRVNGTTALMAAAMATDVDEELVLEIIKLLLDNGAILNTGDLHGRTAFMSLVANDYERVVRYVLQDVGIEASDNEGNTALYYAIDKKRYDMVKLLLENGANTDIENNYGQSPEMFAISNGFERMNEFFPEEPQYEVPAKFLSMCRPEELAPTVFPNADVPPFFFDLRRMLCQMKSESLEPLFVGANTSLMEFLAINEEQLCAIGIEFPFQRKRIRYSLNKFHRKEFSPHTFRPFKDNHTMGDLFSTVSGDLKQLLLAEASIKYLLNGQFDPKRPNNFAEMANVLQNIRQKLTSIRAIVAEIHHASGLPVQYIPPQEPRPVKQYSVRWFRVVMVSSSVLLGSGFFARKYVF